MNISPALVVAFDSWVRSGQDVIAAVTRAFSLWLSDSCLDENG
jgi:hypothetical protein